MLPGKSAVFSVGMGSAATFNSSKDNRDLRSTTTASDQVGPHKYHSDVAR